MTLEQRTQNTHLIRFFFFQFCINQQKLTLLSEGCSGEVFWPRLDAFSTEHTRSGSVGMREGQASERRFIKSVPNLVASSGSVGLAIGYPFGVLLPSERTHHFATPTVLKAHKTCTRRATSHLSACSNLIFFSCQIQPRQFTWHRDRETPSSIRSTTRADRF